MPISKNEANKIAELANLELTEREKESFSNQLAAIVAYIDQLNELDTSNVKAWQQSSAGYAMDSFATREDFVEQGLGQEKALENAPDPDQGFFRVPRVIGN